MKKEVKKRFQEMVLEAVRSLPIYPHSHLSDTTVISWEVAKRHRNELIKMGILCDLSEIYREAGMKMDPYTRHISEGYRIQDRVLRQLNNLHREGKVAKKMSYGGAGQGRNYTFIRWGKHAQ